MLRCAASFVIAAHHNKYASFLADLRALPANILRSRLKIDFLQWHQLQMTNRYDRFFREGELP